MSKFEQPSASAAETTEDFAQLALKIEQAVADAHQKPRADYKKTVVGEHAIDEASRTVAFTLMEQIDKDASGDQIRWSLWKSTNGQPAEMLFEDHAWTREKRDPGLENVRIEDGEIKVTADKGEQSFAL